MSAPVLPSLPDALTFAGANLHADDVQLMGLHMTRDEQIILAHAMRDFRARHDGAVSVEEREALQSISESIEENVFGWDALHAFKAGDAE